MRGHIYKLWVVTRATRARLRGDVRRGGHWQRRCGREGAGIGRSGGGKGSRGNGGGNGGREGIGESKTTANGGAAVGDDGDSKENPPPQASQAQQDSDGGNGIGGGGQLPSDAHPEIIQRSKPILKMLAKKGKLTARDIDTVWGTAERAGSHASSLMGAVYVEVERLVMGRRE